MNHLQSDALLVEAEAGVILVQGAPGIAITLTREAAVRTALALLDAAAIANSQSPLSDCRDPVMHAEHDISFEN